MRLGLALSVGLAFGLSACGHQLDSPAPSTSNINPNLVCSQQLTKQIVLSGMNLTPLPTKTLGREVLNLPTVTLTESSGLDGSAASSAPIQIADDPNNPGASHVRWESEEQLGFDFTPDLNAMPGLYDVTVTNPDGKSSTLPGTLAVVPPPMVGAVMPPNICDAQGDQTVTVTGSGFLMVGTTTPTVEILDASGMTVFSVAATLTGCTMVAGDRMPPLQECTGLSFVIPTGAVMPGQYTLRVTNPPSAECSSTAAVPFVVEPPPHIDSVLPNHICVGGGTLDVKGTGFLPGAKVSLDDPTNLMSTAASAVAVSSDGTSANAMFGAVNAAPGDTVDLTLQNADGCSDTLKGAVKVLPGPIIFYVDPPFTYSGITTPAIIYTTGITGPLPSTGAVVLTPNGATTPSYDLSSMAKIDPNHPKHVIVNIPPAPTLPAGTYDLLLADASGCPAVFPKAITVVSQKTDLKDMLPPFGYDSADTSVTIDATAALFKAGARAYLAPHGGGSVVATPLSAVVFQSATQLTAVVPGATNKLTDGLYDLVTVNPDGTIGFLDSAFTVVATAPPVVTGVSPGSLPTNCAPCSATLQGQGFLPAAPPMVTATCTPPGMAAMPETVTVSNPTATTLDLALPFVTGLTGGTVCTFRVSQGGVYADGGTLVVTIPSSNLTATTAGMPLNTARRAPGLVFDGPTAAARYLYVIGGDSGLDTMPLDSVEFAKADGATGGSSAWMQLPDATAKAATQGQLPTARTYAGAAAIGRFIYLVGGFDGTNSLKDVERAEVLDPADTPQIDDADLTPDATNGLAPGLYFYRVSAVLSGVDVNPGGETLASDEFAIRVPQFQNDKFQVTLAWINKPANAVKWRIYRTSMPDAAPGSEDVVFETADASMSSFIDKGATLTPFTAGSPLPFGAIGNWKSIAQLNTARAGAGVTVVADPSTAGRFYLYAGYGYDKANSALPASYEVLNVDLSGNSVTESAWSQQAITGGIGRWLLGAWAATPDLDQIVAPKSYVYFGPGDGSQTQTGAMPSGIVEVGTVPGGGGATGGVLTTVLSQAVTGKTAFGYGAVSAVDTVFELGGEVSGGFTEKMNGSTIGGVTKTPPTLGTFGPQGGGQISSGAATVPLYLPGATIGGAYFWLAGGATGSLASQAATKDTFFVLY